MNQFFTVIPHQLSDFFVVVLFSLIIGMMQRHIHCAKEDNLLIGTDRTFTFIGILGYLLLVGDLSGKMFLYLGGGVVLAGFLAIFYFNRIRIQQDFGLTTVLIAMLTYCIPLLLLTQPFWFTVLVFVGIIMLTEMKSSLVDVAEKVDKGEILTLAKFLTIACVILPIVPDKPLVDFLRITPYKIWLSVVVISSISYVSYLLQKFVFKKPNFFITGILGGLYSSTATTVVLARKMKHFPGHALKITGSLVLATAMMYFRIILLVIIFNPSLLSLLGTWLGVMVVVSFLTGMIFYYKGRTGTDNEGQEKFLPSGHPLELRMAVMFTLLFMGISFLVYYIMHQFGSHGLTLFSWLMGIMDIDPFLLTLFQGHYDISTSQLAHFSFYAIVSNNVMKMFTGMLLGEPAGRKWVALGFVLIITINLLILLFI